MQKTPILKSPEMETSYVDVLFVTDQANVPDPLLRELAGENLIWDKITVEEFLADDHACQEFGTVVLDTSRIATNRHETLWRRLKRLEQANIAAILLNDHVNFPFDRFKLATLLRTASLEEMIGRIEANLAYNRSTGINGSPTPPAPPQPQADLTEQLIMAGHVQRNFLPKRLPNLRNVHWAALFEPADWVSGDMYDIQRLDEQHIGFYVADAVGHSIPAALLTMFLKQAIKMRETTGQDYRIFGPVEVMNTLNSAMSDQNLAGCLFATCCYGLLNVRTLQLTFARAGHPYPVLIHAGEAPVQLESRGGLLGVFENTEFEQKSIQLATGDKVLFYSDGCERFIGTGLEDGGFEFTQDFTSIAGLNVGQMLSRFHEILHKGNVASPEIDDVTVIALEIT